MGSFIEDREDRGPNDRGTDEDEGGPRDPAGLNADGDADVDSDSDADGVVDFERPATTNEELGRVLEGFREYLLLVARRDLAPDLAAKVGASDLVQETFLAAGRDIDQWRGRGPRELRSWLEGILQHTLANTRRHYRGTAKRRLGMEVRLQGGGGDGAAAGPEPSGPTIASASSSSPSRRAMKNEREAALVVALRSLPERHRQVIQWHHQDRLTFEAIAARLGCSSEAARKLWARALLRLRAALGDDHDPE